VIGGGPAGSSTAAYLQQKDYHVVLLEKQRHPRYAVGESLIPDFWKYCDLLGVSEKLEAEGFIKKAGGLINWKAQPRAHNFSDFGYSRPALHVERDRFDHILLEHSRELGVEVFEEVAATGARFEQGEEGLGLAHVKFRPTDGSSAGEIRCRFVVDATGQGSLLGRQLGWRVMDDAHRFMSVWGYFTDSKYFSYDGVAHPHEDLAVVPPTTYITSLDETGDSGWAWHISLRDNTSVGLVLPTQILKEVRRPAESWESFFQRRCSEIPVLSQLLAGATYTPGSLHMTRDYSYRLTDIAGPNCFLVGDAAGFVDPIFSVGCVISFYSAFAAAWAIDRCFRDPAGVARTQALYAKQLQGRLEIARNLALPGYEPSREESELAKSALRLQRQEVQGLMQVVSTLTTRSGNIDEMMAEDGIELATAGKIRVFQELKVDQ